MECFKGELFFAFAEFQHSCAAEQEAAIAQQYAFNVQQQAFKAYMFALTCLTHFKKIYKKIHSKEYHFVKQSLYELEAEEAKMGFNSIVVETADI